MDSQKLNMLLKEAIQSKASDPVSWMSLRLERDLLPAELDLVKKYLVKYEIAQILHYESTYLNEEELMHRINQKTKDQISVPLTIQLVISWHKNEKNMKTIDELMHFLDETIA